MAQILEAYGDWLTPKKKTDVLQQLRRNVNKMNDLLDDILALGQKDLDRLQFNPELLDLPEFCHSLIEEVQSIFSKHHQPINFDYQPTATEFNLDRRLLNYVLLNLLTNACKYSPSHSTIDFKVELQAKELIFMVSDRGMGIPLEDLSQLFDLFYRASNAKNYQVRA